MLRRRAATAFTPTAAASNPGPIPPAAAAAATACQVTKPPAPELRGELLVQLLVADAVVE